jgi:hypothetical protein
MFFPYRLSKATRITNILQILSSIAYLCDKLPYKLPSVTPNPPLRDTISNSANTFSAAGLRKTMFFRTTLVAAMLAMAPFSSAHITMNKPVPYGKPNSSPLEESGLNFPCKAVPYTINKMT